MQSAIHFPWFKTKGQVSECSTSEFSGIIIFSGILNLIQEQVWTQLKSSHYKDQTREWILRSLTMLQQKSSCCPLTQALGLSL